MEVIATIKGTLDLPSEDLERLKEATPDMTLMALNEKGKDLSVEFEEIHSEGEKEE